MAPYSRLPGTATVIYIPTYMYADQAAKGEVHFIVMGLCLGHATYVTGIMHGMTLCSFHCGLSIMFIHI